MSFKLLRSFTAIGILSLIFVNAFAQSNKVLIHYSAPRLVNFTERAQYQLAHPVKKKRHSIEQGEDKDEDFKFKPQPVPADAVSFSIKMPLTNSSQKLTAVDSTPQPSNVFNGIQDNGTLIPPDISGVAGNTYIMETTNQEFDIFKKTGGGAVAILALENFFSATGGGGYFDPHILYDVAHQRYVVCADGAVANGDGGVFIGVSQTNDPTGNWYVYSLDGIRNDSDFLDYPLIGFNNKWVVLTGNDFLANGSNVPSKIYVFNRDSLYAGSSGTANQFTDPDAFTLCPSTTQDTSVADEYLVQDWDGNTSGKGYIELTKITGSANSPSYTVVKTIGVNQPWNENTINAAQNDTPSKYDINSGDTRIMNAVYENGSLWFAHTVFLPATGSPTYMGADAWQIDPAVDSVLQFIRIADPNKQTLYYYPSVNVDPTGDVLVGYATSSTSLFASAGYAYRAATDPINTIRPGFIFKNGLAAYYKDFGSGRNRWGDFTYTCPDPVDNSFWTFQQFANTDENWGTVIANVGGAPCSDAPVAGTIVPLSDTICGGTSATLNLSGNSASAEGLHIQWQESVTGTVWTNINGATSSQFFSNPLFSSTYFRSIVSCDNSGLADTTSPFVMTVHGITSIPKDSFCEAGINTLVVNATGAVNWFANQSSSTSISNTDSLTANIKGDTIFYVSAGISHSYVTGINNNSVGSGAQYSNFAQGLEFTAISSFVLDSLNVYPGSAGVITVNVVNVSTSAVIGTESFIIPDSSVTKKTVLRLNMNIEGGADYDINANGSTVSAIYRSNTGAVYPYVVPKVISINRAINDADGYYYFFYNWHVSTGCGATRIPVPVYVDKLIIAGSDTLCAGDTEILSVTNASSVVWQPGNINSDSIIISPQIPTTYTVSGIDMRGCALTDSFTVNVKNCALGVKPIAENAEVNVFPNPAMNEVNVEFSNVPIHNYTIAMFNTLGQKMYETNQTINSHYKIVPVDLSLFSSGVYFINIKSDNQQWMKKIIKE